VIGWLPEGTPDDWLAGPRDVTGLVEKPGHEAAPYLPPPPTHLFKPPGIWLGGAVRCGRQPLGLWPSILRLEIE
jgi:hypothetical protein